MTSSPSPSPIRATGERVIVDTSNSGVRRRYEAIMKGRRQELTRLFRQLQIDHIPLRTDRDVERPLMQFFERRAARLAHE
jgi:CelD/BcsL family acetyltransferase involved in cellulose biosynthesis